MRKLILLSLFISGFIVSFGQSKINPSGLIRLKGYIESAGSGDNNVFRPLGETEVPEVGALVVMDSPESAASFDAESIKVNSVIGRIMVVTLPIDRIESLAERTDVVSIEFNEKITPSLDFARPSGSVTNVQDGFLYNGQTTSYDGSGVICGMMDVGLEANHVNFKKDDGTSRISRLWYFTGNNGTYSEFTPSTISNFTTDDMSGTHATHVAGIIGGSYKGSSTFIKMVTADGTAGTAEDDSPNPFYGVATGADLAFSVGQLYTDNIVQGVKNIMDYAESVGKPVVVNLSLGHTSGPHDGTDAYSQALSELGKRGIICMSAGNDGDANCSIQKRLTSTASGKQIKTFITDSKANGIVDIWASDDKTLTVQWCIYDKDKQTLTPIIESSSPGTSKSAGTDFQTYFNGSIETVANLNTANNRYQVYNELNNVSLKAGNTSMYLALTVSGTSGQTVYIYGGTDVTFSKIYSSSQGGLLSGYTEGSPANSINDGCCADNIISVGAYTSRVYWGCLGGGVYSYNGHTNVGDIAPFSSYGSTFQGKKLPLVTGPGTSIVSSYSRYYTSLNTGSMTASAANGSAVDYWGAMQGTSMSCPYVTGIIGLWLQADPTLNFETVMDVINNSSTAVTTNAGRWGAGKIDALKGIQYVLAEKAAGIGEVWADDNQRLVLTPTADGYDVFVADADRLTVTVYDLQGRPVATSTSLSDSAQISTAHLRPGIYILQAKTPTLTLSRKIALK